VDGWAQGFALPAGGGHLVITRNELARNLSLGAEAAAVLVVFALALPGTRSALLAPAGETEAGPEAAPAPGGRRERASGTRPARRKRRPQFAFAAGRARGAGRAGGAGPDAQAEPQGTPEYAAAAAPASGPGPDVRTEAYGTGPQLLAEPLTDPGAPAPSGIGSSDAPRRPRGQHAARHGKASRRWRGPATPPAPGPSAPGMEDLDEDGDVSSWVTPDPMATDSPAPWESGDRS
jgi:hypothetical protein